MTEAMTVREEFHPHLPPHLRDGLVKGCAVRWLNGVVMIKCPPGTSYPRSAVEYWYRGFRVERVRNLRDIRWGYRSLYRSMSVHPNPLAYLSTLEGIRHSIDTEIECSDLTV